MFVILLVGTTYNICTRSDILPYRKKNRTVVFQKVKKEKGNKKIYIYYKSCLVIIFSQKANIRIIMPIKKGKTII